MSWYSTEEQAAKACIWKTKEYGEEFVVLPEVTKLGNDPFETTIYWAQRKSSL